MDIYAIALIIAFVSALLTWLYIQNKQKDIINERDMYLNKMNEYADNEDKLIQQLNNLQQQQHSLEKDLAVKISEHSIITDKSENLEQALKESTQTLKKLNIEHIDNTAKLNRSETLASELKSNHDKEVENNKSLLNKLENNEENIVKLKERNADLNANHEQINQRYQELLIHHQKLQGETSELRDKHHALESKLRSQNTMISEREDKLSDLKTQFEEQKRSLSDEFKALSQEILKKEQTALVSQNKEGINALITPLQQQIKRFESRVNEVHTEQTKGQTQLETQIFELNKMSIQLKDGANNLTNALKNDKKMQGNWGEIQVERLLENAGLKKDKEFKREDSFKNINGDVRRPDFVLYLPENKHIIIDSKVSLNAYVKGANATTDEERNQALDEHVANIAKHIDTLASKEYSGLTGIQSPDFVFMFMPVEPAYIAAFEHDPSLFNRAYDRKIAVVTPNTLLPILRTIASLWNIDKQNQSTKQLAQEAGKVYNKLRVFCEKFIKVESQLNNVAKSYDEARKSLTGPRSLISIAENFKDLGVKVEKDLPTDLIEESKQGHTLINNTSTAPANPQ